MLVWPTACPDFKQNLVYSEKKTGSLMTHKGHDSTVTMTSAMKLFLLLNSYFHMFLCVSTGLLQRGEV